MGASGSVWQWMDPRERLTSGQMADGAEIMKSIQKRDGVEYPVLVPNLAGFKRALEASARQVARLVVCLCVRAAVTGS